MEKYVTYEQALARKVIVSDSFSLKEAVRKGEVMIVSTDQKLYAELVARFSKAETAKKAKTIGGAAITIGVVGTLLTGGLLAPVVAAAGIASTVTGAVLDDYKNYSLSFDFEKKNVIFFKVKGKPCLKAKDVHKHTKEPIIEDT